MAIRVNLVRPMREGESDMWVWRQGHMGRSGEGLGTVQVRWRCTGMAGEEVVLLVGNLVKEYCVFGQLSFLAPLLLNIYFDLELWPLGNFSPSCNFEKFTQLVPGLLFLTFDGFGFDLWAKLVLRLWNLDKLSFNVVLFDENLLPDPAFLCGF
uniref:Uncharacterized protein n=1 Tax=Tanacetum cinerariifolium TaxID=118510 RepID=A0A6L2N3L7_TANCI|nr:hypothetical protein [Tanacetum cinerariifolium]